MCYALIGISAFIICLILNKDILFKKSELTSAYKIYRLFLISLMVFFASDAIWGLLDEYHLLELLTIDTLVFFISMSFSVVFWSIFVTVYVNKNQKMNVALLVGGVIILLFIIVLCIVNFFNPLLFTFDGNTYVPRWGRTLMYILQIILFAIVSFTNVVSPPALITAPVVAVFSSRVLFRTTAFPAAFTTEAP